MKMVAFWWLAGQEAASKVIMEAGWPLGSEWPNSPYPQCSGEGTFEGESAIVFGLCVLLNVVKELYTKYYTIGAETKVQENCIHAQT